MNIINFFVNLIKDPRTAIASWIAMGVAPTLGFIFLIVFIETGVVFFRGMGVFNALGGVNLALVVVGQGTQGQQLGLA